MLPNSFKKLQLKKSVVAKLDKDSMQQIHGGQIITLANSCGAQCQSVYIDCNQTPMTVDNCGSFADGPTCRGTICGSDIGCVHDVYTHNICTGFEYETGGWRCSICVC